MSTFKNPVGPQTPKVYWRRRLMVGLGALAVVIVIILILNRPSTDSKAAVPTDAPAASHSVAPTKPAVDGADCLPANIKLEAVADKATYLAGEQPQISMKITNTGHTGCTINLGSTQQELIITSGSEQIWDSKDCQTAAVDAPTTLTAGQVVPTPAIPWDRTRSSKTTCATTQPPVTAGGASYHLSVKVGALKSKDTVQFLLK
jgi:hypothetical protein